MQFTKAEELVIKHLQAKLGRRFYVWLGVGLVNWIFNEVYGHYLQIPLNAAKVWLHEFRINVDEPLFRRNGPQHINGILIDMLRASSQEQTGEVPGADFTSWVTARANRVRADYLVLFPPLPEEED